MSPMKSPQKLGALDVAKNNKIVVEKDEVEEELIPGWTKEVKIRKAGSATKVDRFYTDPVTGYVFHSFRDVQRYLKTGEVGRLATKPKVDETEKQSSETSTNKRALADKPDCPARASKRLAGINSDTPLSPSQPKTRQATRLAGIKVEAPLPSQSLSEPETRQATRPAGVAVDASPLPPEPKTRQATRLAGVAVDASLPSRSPPEPKTRQATRLAGMTADAPSPSRAEPKTRRATRLAEVASNASVPSPSQPEPKTRQGTGLEQVAADAALPSPLLPDTRSNCQATKQNGTKIDASVPSPSPSPVVPKTRQAARQAGSKIDSPPPLPPDSKTHQATPQSQPEPKTRQAKRASGILGNVSPTSPPQPKTRRAIQQAGIKIESPPPSPPDTRTSRQATQTRLVNSTTRKENDKKIEAEKPTDKHHEKADMDTNTNHNQEGLITTHPLNQESNEKKENNKQIETVPTTLQSPEGQPLPTIVPQLNSEKQKSPVVNPTISNPLSQDSYGSVGDTKPDSSINFSMNDLWTDPCIEFAVKTLTGAIPVTDLNKVENFTSPVKVPLEELWTDPCIEFAVKTLTGAIPVGEDDYVLHRPSSSTNPQGPYSFSSPVRVGQTGLKNKQQDLVFPPLGNGGFQKSGKFVNGSNGQCSRPRFFQ